MILKKSLYCRQIPYVLDGGIQIICFPVYKNFLFFQTFSNH